MNGQAETAPASEGMDSLAEFLETSEQDPEEQALADPVETPEEAETQTDEPEEEATDEEAEPEEKPTPERKIAVTVKGADGADTKLEVTEEELVKGYHRQADYTRKTQELAQREDQAVQFLAGKHQEVQANYVRQLETERLAIAQLAGFKSDAEMAQLANSDPATYVAESHRQQQIKSFLMNLDQKMHQERAQAAEMAQRTQQEATQKTIQKSWEELEKLKIDKPKLAEIYKKTNEAYGFSQAEMAGITDHRLVKMMADATAYRALKTQAPQVVQKANSAPRMPSKQNQPANARVTQAVNERFKSGRAKLNDLANYLNT